jgi:hypothetical protein
MRSEVYSWRVSRELKADLEREARLRSVSASAVLDMAVRDWLKKSRTNTADEELQRKLHAEVENCLGVLAGHDPRRSEMVRDTVRKRLARRRAH